MHKKMTVSLVALTFSALLGLPSGPALAESKQPITRLKPSGFLGLGALEPASHDDLYARYFRFGDDNATTFQGVGPKHFFGQLTEGFYFCPDVHEPLRGLLSRSPETEKYLQEYETNIGIANGYRTAFWGLWLTSVGLLGGCNYRLNQPEIRNSSSEDNLTMGLLLGSVGALLLSLIPAIASSNHAKGAIAAIRDGVEAYNQQLGQPAQPPKP